RVGVPPSPAGRTHERVARCGERGTPGQEQEHSEGRRGGVAGLAGPPALPIADRTLCVCPCGRSPAPLRVAARRRKTRNPFFLSSRGYSSRRWPPQHTPVRRRGAGG